MHAFILAGGFATRLWPLTEKRAKPLLPLAGKPLLTHIVEKIPQGMPITVSTNAALAAGFAAWKETHRRPITIVVEQTTNDADKLGALGAVTQWIHRERMVDDILLLTGDNYFGFSLKDFLDMYHTGVPLIAAYDIGDTEKAKVFGVVTVKRDSGNPPSTNNIVTAFEEKPKHPLSTLVSTGCSILPHETLPILVAYAREHPDDIGGIFEELLRQGTRIHCFIFDEPWFDIGSYDAYLEATRALVPPGIPVI
ncbi:nucleotidyltransferase family protein, partial [Candidatus Peregrinibacteria bacterium]|nr:nucleotidyltransferase family protein [Candidatus Peregrinibacteria bacterium]